MCRRYQWATRRMARSLRSFCDSCGSLRLSQSLIESRILVPKMYWNVRCFFKRSPFDWKPTSKFAEILQMQKLNIIQNAEAISIQPYWVEEGWCLANPVWWLILSKKIVSDSCHYTHTQKVLKLFLNYSQLQVAGDFGPKRQQQVGGRMPPPSDETPRLVTGLATSNEPPLLILIERKFEGTNSWSVQSFFVQISGSLFFTQSATHLFKRKKKKVDLPGKIQVVINFHQLETPYNQQSSSVRKRKKNAKKSYVFQVVHHHLLTFHLHVVPFGGFRTHQMWLPGTVPHRSHGRIHSLEATKKYRERKNNGEFFFV